MASRNNECDSFRTPPATRKAPCAAEPGPFRLLDLADELLSKVLKSGCDCVALVRLSVGCKSLLREARADDVWQPILLGFFDGELPPSNSLRALPALEALRQQVLFARQLCEREVELSSFMISQQACLWRPEERWVAPGADRWHRAQTRKIDKAWEAKQAKKKAAAVARGEYRKGRFDRPNHGMQISRRMYGSFVRIDAAFSDREVSENSFTHWLKLDAVPTLGELQFKTERDYDYGLMCEWRDTKLVEMAERWLEDDTAERLRAQKVHRSLEGRYAASTSSYEAHDGPAQGGITTQTAGPHMYPKLMCGLYGGTIRAHTIPYSMGFGPYLELECVVDGATRSTGDCDDL